MAANIGRDGDDHLGRQERQQNWATDCDCRDNCKGEGRKNVAMMRLIIRIDPADQQIARRQGNRRYQGEQ